MVVRTKMQAAVAATPLTVKVVPVGPDPVTVDKLARRVLNHPSVQKHLKRGRHRLLSLELLEPEERVKRARPVRPSRHRATI